MPQTQVGNHSRLPALGNRLQQMGSNEAITGGGAASCQQQAGATISYAWANYSGNNQMTSTSQNVNQSSGYDAAGDIMNDGKNQYLYNADGKICAVEWTYNTMVVMTGYIYDAEGNRVAKGAISTMSCDPSANGFTTQADYVRDQAGHQLSEFRPGQDGTMAWQHTNVYANGELIATDDTTETHYYLDDWLGTRRVQTDYEGTVEQACSSVPYGDGETCAPTPTENLFTGKERDSESGNDYFGARYYASSMGRWSSPDPSGLLLANPLNPQSFNLYSYVGNSPVRLFDPDGLSWFTQPCTSSGPGTGAEESATSLVSRVGTFLGNVFCGGGGGGGDDPPPGWRFTPPSSGHYVTVGFYPAGAGWMEHVGVGLDTPKNTLGWATLNKHPFVLYLTGYPFAGQLKADRVTYRDRMSGLATPQYFYRSISDQQFDAMQSAIDTRNDITDPSKNVGNYDLYFRNCAQFVEDVLHAGSISDIPHHEIFAPLGLRLLFQMESHVAH